MSGAEHCSRGTKALLFVDTLINPGNFGIAASETVYTGSRGRTDALLGRGLLISFSINYVRRDANSSLFARSTTKFFDFRKNLISFSLAPFLSVCLRPLALFVAARRDATR